MQLKKIMVAVWSTHHIGIQVTLCCRPALGGHQSVEGRKLLLRSIDGGHVVGREALLVGSRHINRPVAVLWRKCVDGNGFGLNAGLHKTEKKKTIYQPNMDPKLHHS